MERFNTCTLNSPSYVGVAGGCEVMLSGLRKVGRVLILACEASHMSS